MPNKRIGISKRLAVIDVTFKEDPNAKLVIANPEIIRTEGRHTQNEGCLSIPDFREPVSRARKVRIRAQDLTGKWFEKTGEDLLVERFCTKPIISTASCTSVTSALSSATS